MAFTLDGEEPHVSTVLREHGLAPRKRLGQNFLRDRSYLRTIVEAAELDDQDEVVEVGAGTGILTRALLEACGRVLAIELDDSLFQVLQREFASTSNLRLWHGNALEFEPAASVSPGYKLVGNIPYYITGVLLRRFLEIDFQPAVLVFMVQHEVAERIVAAPGKLSILGVSTQFYAQATVVGRVPARAFFPVPKVDSAIIKLVPFAARPMADTDAFFRVVKAGFSMRRKQLINALGGGLNVGRDTASELLAAGGIDGTRRAETMSVSEWVTLTVSAKRLNVLENR